MPLLRLARPSTAALQTRQKWGTSTLGTFGRKAFSVPAVLTQIPTPKARPANCGRPMWALLLCQTNNISAFVCICNLQPFLKKKVHNETDSEKKKGSTNNISPCAFWLVLVMDGGSCDSLWFFSMLHIHDVAATVAGFKKSFMTNSTSHHDLQQPKWKHAKNWRLVGVKSTSY